jgi:hypothetical protein
MLKFTIYSLEFNTFMCNLWSMIEEIPKKFWL